VPSKSYLKPARPPATASRPSAQRESRDREIALALGVPPMLLGIPGDNTYSNYQEATRSFWRQVLPKASK